MHNQAASKIEKHMRGAAFPVSGDRGCGRSFANSTLLAGIPDESLVVCEDIAGPVASFDTEQELVERPNDIGCMLVAHAVTEDGSRPQRTWQAHYQTNFQSLGITRAAAGGQK
ncbi:hypothetical protein IVB30_32250 [Bradyrhizobium sp. 200]|uniref:hypothetical protein n=1 Tax=Bradyrhizobium sp. 200 TaxID=2782665 RepID=UPI001FFE3354|nr:hypothetical protein [Bradyrhizobium sp. 200]UPJ47838.1 hypothetical protein IVB30_32250 [Bradyrhizobium sp. 200]